MSREFIDEADRELTETYEEPMNLDPSVSHSRAPPSKPRLKRFITN